MVRRRKNAVLWYDDADEDGGHYRAEQNHWS